MFLLVLSVVSVFVFVSSQCGTGSSLLSKTIPGSVSKLERAFYYTTFYILLTYNI